MAKKEVSIPKAGKYVNFEVDTDKLEDRFRYLENEMKKVGRRDSDFGKEHSALECSRANGYCNQCSTFFYKNVACEPFLELYFTKVEE